MAKASGQLRLPAPVVTASAFDPTWPSNNIAVTECQIRPRRHRGSSESSQNAAYRNMAAGFPHKQECPRRRIPQGIQNEFLRI